MLFQNDPELVNPCFGDTFDYSAPTFPGEPGFDEELNDVRRAAEDRATGRWPSWLFEKVGLPEYPSGPVLDALDNTTVLDGHETVKLCPVDAAAELVRNDDPVDFYLMHAEWLTAQGFYPRPSRPEWHNCVNFIDAKVTNRLRLATSQTAAMHRAFDVKSGFQRPRPSDVDGTIDLAYPNPRHFAYPAGHGTNFGASAYRLCHDWQCKNGDRLPLDIQQQIVDNGRHCAHYRTIAGVHYLSDNDFGFSMGWHEAAKHEMPL